MEKIYLVKNVILGNTLHKPGSELSIPDELPLERAKALVKDGYAVNATAKAPAQEDEQGVVEAIESAKKVPDIEKAVASVEKPTEGIFAAAAAKVKELNKRPKYKAPKTKE